MIEISVLDVDIGLPRLQTAVASIKPESVLRHPLHRAESRHGGEWSKLREILSKIFIRTVTEIFHRTHVIIPIGAMSLRVSLDKLGIGRMLAIRGFRELDQEYIFRQILRRNDHCLEVGANIGYYAILIAASLDGECVITAYEPNPHARAELLVNLHINSLCDRVSVSSHAVSDSRRLQTFYCTDRSNLSSLQVSTILTRPVTELITCEVDDLFDVLNGARRISVLRMDLEGHEQTVLKRLADIAETNPERLPRNVVFEPHAWEYVDPDAFEHTLNRLVASGYIFKYIGVWRGWAGGLELLGYAPVKRIQEAGRTKLVFCEVPAHHAIHLMIRASRFCTVCLERS